MTCAADKLYQLEFMVKTMTRCGRPEDEGCCTAIGIRFLGNQEQTVCEIPAPVECSASAVTTVNVGIKYTFPMTGIGKCDPRSMRVGVRLHRILGADMLPGRVELASGELEVPLTAKPDEQRRRQPASSSCGTDCDDNPVDDGCDMTVPMTSCHDGRTVAVLVVNARVWCVGPMMAAPIACPIPCPTPCGVRPAKCPTPCPAKCPTPCMCKCPTPCPPKCPTPCPPKCPTPCPPKCPTPCMCKCPTPCPPKCPTPCPPKCPTPCPPKCPTPCMCKCPTPCPPKCPTPCPPKCPTPCPPKCPNPCMCKCPTPCLPKCPTPCPPKCPTPCPPKCPNPCMCKCPTPCPPKCPTPCPPKCPTPCPPMKPPCPVRCSPPPDPCCQKKPGCPCDPCRKKTMTIPCCPTGCPQPRLCRRPCCPISAGSSCPQQQYETVSCEIDGHKMDLRVRKKNFETCSVQRRIANEAEAFACRVMGVVKDMHGLIMDTSNSGGN